MVVGREQTSARTWLGAPRGIFVRGIEWDSPEVERTSEVGSTDLTYGTTQPLIFADKVLGASDKWNEELHAFAHIVRPDAGPATSRRDQITDALAKDKCGIALAQTAIAAIARACAAFPLPLRTTVRSSSTRLKTFRIAPIPLFNEAYFYTTVKSLARK